jgi:hypothetical protein
MKRLSKLQTETPEVLSNPDVFDLAEQADRLQELKALYDTEGGKQLVKLLVQDASIRMQQLCGSYKTMSHMDIVSVIADIDAHMATARLLLNAKEGVAILDAELQDALRE